MQVLMPFQGFQMQNWKKGKSCTSSIPEPKIHSLSIHTYIGTEVVENSRNIILNKNQSRELIHAHTFIYNREIKQHKKNKIK